MNLCILGWKQPRTYQEWEKWDKWSKCQHWVCLLDGVRCFFSFMTLPHLSSFFKWEFGAGVGATANHTKTLKENLRRIRGGRELWEASSDELLCGLYPFGNCFADLRVPQKRDSRDGTGKVPWLGGVPTPVCELSEQGLTVLYFWVLLCWASLQVQVGPQAVFVDFRIHGRRLWQIPLATLCFQGVPFGFWGKR